MKIKIKNDFFGISVKKHFHLDIWEEDDSLNFAVRERLLDIANDFIEYLEILDTVQEIPGIIFQIQKIF